MPSPSAAPAPAPLPPPRESARLRTQRLGAILVVGVALADFLRWRGVAAGWMGFGPVTPMAPATGWLFVLLGTALGLHLFFPVQPLARRLAAALSALAALAALHVVFCHWHGRTPPWETWLGFGGKGVGGFTVGYISTQSAVLALGSNFALLALFSPLARRPAWRDAGIFAALAVEFFALVTAVSYAAGNPSVSNDGWLKVAPLVMAEFTLFNFVLLFGGRATNRLRQWFFGTDPSAPDFAPVSREERFVFALLGGAGLLALTVSIVYLRIATGGYQARSIEALQRMADLKVGEIEHWRHERMADAHVLMRMPGLGATVGAVSDGTASSSRRARFFDWLRLYAQNYGYANIVVFDGGLKPVPDGAAAPGFSTPGLSERLRELRPDSGVIELPPYVDAAGRLRWDLLVPLPAGVATGLEGAILLQTDPTRFIIPILQSWPAEYQTGQSVLWHRAGDLLVALGGYRPAPGVTSEELRPFGTTRVISKLPPDSLPARFSRGEIAGGEGPDYRGVLIVGVGRPVPDSPWIFSSRLDSSEIYAPLRRTALGVAGIVAGLFLTTGFATSWLWRQRQKNLVHDRITAELEQKRTAARLGAVMRHAKDIILLLDEGLHVLDANQQAIETYGWPREELLQKTIGDLRAPGTPARLQDVLASAAAQDGAVFETLHRRKDGTTFPAEASVRQVEIDGQWHLLSILRDITERQRAEKKLRQLSSIIEQAPLSVIITDLEGTVEYVNPKFCAVTGYTREETIGRNATGSAMQELQPEAFAAMWRAVTANQAWTGEVHSRRKNGEIFLENVVAAPLIDESGRATHYVALRDDITAQRHFEAETAAMLAKEREVSDMKSQFISVASHEFRTPLAAAVGSIELLERHAAKLTEAKRRELLGRVQGSLGRLTEIMNSVLQLSRADSGRLKVKWMNVDLARFAQDVVNEVAEGDRHQHTFAFRQSGGPATLPADTNLLHHILSNLVGNAARYSPPGTTVTVTLALEAAAFALTVADEGIGIPEAEREKIFEPFVRGSNVGQIGGTGLGLNIVKRYTELMGGRIEVLPAGRGATFRIHIPVPATSPSP